MKGCCREGFYKGFGLGVHAVVCLKLDLKYYILRSVYQEPYCAAWKEATQYGNP